MVGAYTRTVGLSHRHHAGWTLYHHPTRSRQFTLAGTRIGIHQVDPPVVESGLVKTQRKCETVDIGVVLIPALRMRPEIVIPEHALPRLRSCRTTSHDLGPVRWSKSGSHRLGSHSLGNRENCAFGEARMPRWAPKGPGRAGSKHETGRCEEKSSRGTHSLPPLLSQ